MAMELLCIWVVLSTILCTSSLDMTVRGTKLLLYLGCWFTIVLPQAPEKFFGHFVSRIGCKVHSMRQIPHKKPPLYSTSTKRISYKVFSIVPFADALHEHNHFKLKESVLFRGREVMGRVLKGTVSRKWRMRSNALVFWLNWQVFSISSWSGIVVLYRLVSLPSVVRSLRKRICYLKQSLYFIFVDLFVTLCLLAADFRSQLMCDHVWLGWPSSWNSSSRIMSFNQS